MTGEKACPQCGVENSLNSAFCSGCGSALTDSAQSSRHPDEEVMLETDARHDPSKWLRTDSAQSPQCPDEEVMLEIDALYYAPSRWNLPYGPLRVTANHLCFEGATVDGDVYNDVIPLSAITQMFEKRFRLSPTLVIERGDDKFRFLLYGEAQRSQLNPDDHRKSVTSTLKHELGLEPYSRRNFRDTGYYSDTIKDHTIQFIAFVTAQIDLMNRATHPVTKDEIIEAYRKKVPKKGLSTTFKIYVVLALASIVVMYEAVSWWALLLAPMWGVLLLYDFLKKQRTEIM